MLSSRWFVLLSSCLAAWSCSHISFSCWLEPLDCCLASLRSWCVSLSWAWVRSSWHFKALRHEGQAPLPRPRRERPRIDRGSYVDGRDFDLTAATRQRLRFSSTGTLLSSR